MLSTQQTQETEQPPRQTEQQTAQTAQGQQVGQDQELVNVLMELREIKARIEQLTDQLARELGYPTARTTEELEIRITNLEHQLGKSSLRQARRTLSQFNELLERGEQAFEQDTGGVNQDQGN